MNTEFIFMFFVFGAFICVIYAVQTSPDVQHPATSKELLLNQIEKSQQENEGESDVNQDTESRQENEGKSVLSPLQRRGAVKYRKRGASNIKGGTNGGVSKAKEGNKARSRGGAAAKFFRGAGKFISKAGNILLDAGMIFG